MADNNNESKVTEVKETSDTAERMFTQEEVTKIVQQRLAKVKEVNKATEEEDFALVDRLCEVSGVKVPNAIEEIRNAKVRHTMVCDKDKMQETVTGILGLK